MSSPQERQVRSRNVIVAALIVSLLAIWLVWSQWDRLVGGGEAAPEARPETGPVPAVDASPEGAPELGEAERRWAALFGRAPGWPGEVVSAAECQAAERDLLQLCAVLDTRGLAEVANVPGGSCGLVREVAEALAARPPVLTSELKSHASILSNVFHLFRVLGRERVDLLRRVVREQPELAEPAAMVLYRWLSSRETCARSGQTAIRLPVLYDYAGYLFETMGGQALLRRRGPDVEGLISFYALLVLDRADRSGHNPHGVDPRQEIERTRVLLEGRSWVLGERYEEILEAMARRWDSR